MSEKPRWPESILTAPDESHTEQDMVSRTQEDEEELMRFKRRTVHWVWVVFVWVLMLCGVVTLLIITLNYTMPQEWCWLEEERLHVLTSVYLAGVVGYILKKVDKML